MILKITRIGEGRKHIFFLYFRLFMFLFGRIEYGYVEGSLCEVSFCLFSKTLGWMKSLLQRRNLSLVYSFALKDFSDGIMNNFLSSVHYISVKFSIHLINCSRVSSYRSEPAVRIVTSLKSKSRTYHWLKLKGSDSSNSILPHIAMIGLIFLSSKVSRHLS